MNKKKQILFAAAVMVLLQGAALNAQPYERVVRNNFWLDGSNAAGMRQDMSKTISYAEIGASLESGGFHQYGDAPLKWNAGARAETLVHLKRMSMKGAFSFDQMQGYDMFGSMLTASGYYPLDVYEFTPGRKSRQKYAFEGAVSVDLAEKLRIGGSLSYESSNYTKRKDLRYSNYRLDMMVSAGLQYLAGDWAIGLNALYGKNGETPDPEQLGTATAESYYAFLDKGLTYGSYEIWTGSGVHLDEPGVSGFPLKEHEAGLGLQLQKGAFFAEADWLRTSGKAGEKQFVWYRFPGHRLGIKLGDRFTAASGEHVLRLNADMMTQTTSESILDKQTSGGVTTVSEYGQNQILARRGLDLMLEYEFLGEKWEGRARARVSENQALASQMFPYIFSQSLFRWAAELDAKLHAGRFDLGLAASFGAGRLSETSSESSTSLTTSTTPYRQAEVFAADSEFKTASRLGAELSLRYNFRKGIYLEADGNAIKAFNITVLDGSLRYGASLKFGYTF